MRTLLTSGTIALFAGAALAGDNLSGQSQAFDCGPVIFPQHIPFFTGDDPVLMYDLFPEPNNSPIGGIAIRFHYDELDPSGNPFPDPASRASHVAVTIQFDGGGPTFGFGGSMFNLGTLGGGYSMAQAQAAVDYYDIWDFDGPGSSEPGSYEHIYLFEDPIFQPKPELITVLITDTFNGNAFYGVFEVVILKGIPAPGSAALLAFGGLVLARRRR